jgi:hypothetical protein
MKTHRLPIFSLFFAFLLINTNKLLRTILILLLSILTFISCKESEDIKPIQSATPKVPIISTNPISELTLFSVILSGKLIDTVGSKLIEQGFVVDTLPMPTVTKNLNKFSIKANSKGEFRAEIIDVLANKTWFVRAYGINLQGEGYGEEVKFTSLKEKVFFGNINLFSQQEVNSFGAINYTKIRGTLNIAGSVTDLSPLNSLVVIANAFEVSNTELVNFKGLENLEIIGNEYLHSFRVENNQRLKNFDGLKKLKIVNGNFKVINNDALENLAGLESFTTSANFEFRIDDCDKLTSIKGLEKMQDVLGSITLKNNPLLNDLRPWSNLHTVTERIRIINNPSLQSLDGLEKVKELEGIELVNNTSLRDINGLRNLVTIEEIIEINNNDALTDLSAFNQIITRVKNIYIKNNLTIPNLEGFKNLASINQLVIENNSALTSLEGLQSLKSLGRIEILSNNSLINLRGIDNLTTIAGNIYSIIIWSNKKLQNLDGLHKLTAVQGSIQISVNPALTDFCGLKPLFSGDYNGYYNVENNGSNLTKSQIISTCP